MDSFRTIKAAIQGTYKEKGSRFLAFAFPVSDTMQVKDHLEAIKKEYHDARHHCYAYIIGLEEQQFRANDDGEPGHSAGDPILGQIRSFGLTNVLVVVVRYFGGIKLGVGGLVGAYKQAAFEALSMADMITIYPMRAFQLQFQYELTSEVEGILNDFDIEYTNKSFTDSCQYEGRLRANDARLFQDRMRSVHGVSLVVSG